MFGARRRRGRRTHRASARQAVVPSPSRTELCAGQPVTSSTRQAGARRVQGAARPAPSGSRIGWPYLMVARRGAGLRGNAGIDRLVPCSSAPRTRAWMSVRSAPARRVVRDEPQKIRRARPVFVTNHPRRSGSRAGLPARAARRRQPVSRAACTRTGHEELEHPHRQRRGPGCRRRPGAPPVARSRRPTGRAPTTALAIAPKTATPTALPAERENMLPAVTTPRRPADAGLRRDQRRRGEKPMPRPITKQAAATVPHRAGRVRAGAAAPRRPTVQRAPSSAVAREADPQVEPPRPGRRAASPG